VSVEHPRQLPPSSRSGRAISPDGSKRIVSVEHPRLDLAAVLRNIPALHGASNKNAPLLVELMLLVSKNCSTKLIGALTAL